MKTEYTAEEIKLAAELSAAANEEGTIQAGEMLNLAPHHRPELHTTMSVSVAFRALTGKSYDTAQIEANARLISAAPELLAALQLCAEKLALWPEGSNPEFFPSLKAARAAIAKATGGVK